MSRQVATGLSAATYAMLVRQGLAESYADEAAGRAILRQDLLASLHNTVQHRLDSTAQQVTTHQALLDRQVCPHTAIELCTRLVKTAGHDCT